MMRYPLSDNTNVVVRGAASAKADNQSTTDTGKVGTFLVRQFKGSAFSSFLYGSESEQHNNQRITTLGNDDGDDGKLDSSSVTSSDDEPSRYSEPPNDSTRDEESSSESNCGNCNEDVGSDTAASFSSADDSLLVSENDVDDDGNEFRYGNGGEGLSETDSFSSAISIAGGNDDVLEEASHEPKSLSDNAGDNSLFSGSSQSLFVSNPSDDMSSMPTFESDMLQAIDEAANYFLSFSFNDELGELSTNNGSQKLEIVHISDEAPACSATGQSLPALKPIQNSTCLQRMETESLFYEDDKENIPKHSEGTSSCQDERIAYLEAKLAEARLENECTKEQLEASCGRLDAANTLDAQRKESIAHLEAVLHASEKENADLKCSLTKTNLDYECLKKNVHTVMKNVHTVAEQLRVANTVGLQRKRLMAGLEAKLDATEKDKADLKASLVKAQLDNERKNDTNLADQLDAALSLNASLKTKLSAADQEAASMKEQLDEGNARKESFSCRQDRMIFSLGEKLEQSELEKEGLRDRLLNVTSENRLYEWDITTLKREMAISSSSRASYQIALEENVELVMKLKKEREELKQQLSKAKAEAARTPSVWERLTCV